jgi:hypothetical protein
MRAWTRITLQAVKHKRTFDRSTALVLSLMCSNYRRIACLEDRFLLSNVPSQSRMILKYYKHIWYRILSCHWLTDSGMFIYYCRFQNINKKMPAPVNLNIDNGDSCIVLYLCCRSMKHKLLNYYRVRNAFGLSAVRDPRSVQEHRITDIYIWLPSLAYGLDRNLFKLGLSS